MLLTQSVQPGKCVFVCALYYPEFWEAWVLLLLKHKLSLQGPSGWRAALGPDLRISGYSCAGTASPGAGPRKEGPGRKPFNTI